MQAQFSWKSRLAPELQKQLPVAESPFKLNFTFGHAPFFSISVESCFHR